MSSRVDALFERARKKLDADDRKGVRDMGFEKALKHEGMKGDVHLRIRVLAILSEAYFEYDTREKCEKWCRQAIDDLEKTQHDKKLLKELHQRLKDVTNFFDDFVKDNGGKSVVDQPQIQKKVGGQSSKLDSGKLAAEERKSGKKVEVDALFERARKKLDADDRKDFVKDNGGKSAADQPQIKKKVGGQSSKLDNGKPVADERKTGKKVEVDALFERARKKLDAGDRKGVRDMGFEKALKHEGMKDDIHLRIRVLAILSEAYFEYDTRENCEKWCRLAIDELERTQYDKQLLKELYQRLKDVVDFFDDFVKHSGGKSVVDQPKIKKKVGGQSSNLDYGKSAAEERKT